MSLKREIPLMRFDPTAAAVLSHMPLPMATRSPATVPKPVSKPPSLKINHTKKRKPGVPLVHLQYRRHVSRSPTATQTDQNRPPAYRS